LEQNFVNFVPLEVYSLPHSSHTWDVISRFKNCLEAFSESIFFPSGDLCHACNFSEFFDIEADKDYRLAPMHMEMCQHFMTHILLRKKFFLEGKYVSL
jgi:hypothetical protein